MQAAGLRSATWRQACVATGSTTFTHAWTSKTWSVRAESATSLTLLSLPPREPIVSAYLSARSAPDSSLAHPTVTQLARASREAARPTSVDSEQAAGRPRQCNKGCSVHALFTLGSSGGPVWGVVGPCFQVFSTIQGKTEAKHCLHFCSRPYNSYHAHRQARTCG